MLISLRAARLIKPQPATTLLICIITLAACVQAQSLSPPYLNGMPSVDKVKQVIQGSNPTDTLARQVAIFNLLPTVIQRFRLADRSRYDLTPDEQRVSGQYALAAYQIEQGYDKTHTPEEAKAFTQLHGRYEMELRGEMYDKLFSPAFMAEYRKVDHSVNASYQAHLDQEAHAAERQQQAAQAAASGMRNDAGSVKMRRCLEAGRSETECLSQGLAAGMDELTGGLMGQLNKAMTPPTGLRFSGNFSGTGFGVSFDDQSATVYCGTLQPMVSGYKVNRGQQISVTIGINPKPVTVVLRPDGKLVGPGLVPVAGVVSAGGSHASGPAGPSASAYDTHPVTTTQEKQISAGEAREYGVGEVHQNGAEYSVTTTQAAGASSDTSWAKPRAAAPVVPKTERCNVTTLTGKPVTKLLAAMTQVMGASASKGDTIPVGLRMYGKYGSQGMNIDFAGDLATLECGRARAAETYTVENSGGHITIHVQNQAGPFSLTMQPDGTLVGSGNVDVAGKVLTGHNGNQMIYQAVNGRCALGMLTAKAAQ
jgi:hypothetical protein